MNNRPPARRPTNKYGAPQSPSNMATPRNPEPGNSLGLGGLIFMLVVLGGLGWLSMLIFGWGPYDTEPVESVSVITETPVFTEVSNATMTETPHQVVVSTGTSAPSAEPTAAPTLTLAPMPFVLIGEPEYMNSALIRPQLGCEWLVIAGQVWDLQDKPVTGYTLHLLGELGGYEIEQYKITGSETAYGQSGYEFALEGLVLTSSEALYIQLQDRDGAPLSKLVALATYEDCQKNLILVNFKQVR